MRIALVHDYLIQYGGAERVLSVLCDMFPDAPIYTLLYDETATGRVFKGREIHTSFLQKIPFARRYHRFFPQFMPLAIEQFDLSYFDTVLSVSSSFAKGIITKPTTRHVCYCLTPTRFLWDNSHRYVEEFYFPWPLKKIIPWLLTYLRVWDQEAALRVDEYVAISKFIQRRIKKYYSADSSVIYPPIIAQNYSIAKETGDYFLMVGRLLSYKRFDLAIRAFTAMDLPLKIVGDGPERKRLEKISGKNIEFLGLVSDDILPDLYAKAQALIFPQEEDFGLVLVEAMASGRPVIAYPVGGAAETVIPGETGEFFTSQNWESLLDTVLHFNYENWDSGKIREHAAKFEAQIFKTNIKKYVADRYEEFKKGMNQGALI